MRLRTLIGFGIGYVLGAKSDTNRFDDLQQLYQSVSQSPIFQAMLQQARQTAASGMESLTGQQPTWAPSGNGGQARQQSGQGQQSQESEQGQESEESQEQGQESGKSSNGGGKSKQQSKQQSGQSSG